MDTDQKVVKKTRNRSFAYPGVSLETAIEAISKQRLNLGKGFFKREAIAGSLGYNKLNGAATRKIAALVHYGLLVRKADTYQTSELAERIIYFKSEEDKKRAIIEAVKYPKLFNSLIERYRGQSIPVMLSNILVVDEHINDKVAPNVSEIFRSSLEYAGMLNGNILIDSGSVEDIQDLEAVTEPLLEDKTKTKKNITNITRLDGVPISLGPDITITISETLVKRMALDSEFGTNFRIALEAIKKFAGGEDVGSIDSNEPVENTDI